MHTNELSLIYCSIDGYTYEITNGYPTVDIRKGIKLSYLYTSKATKRWLKRQMP